MNGINAYNQRDFETAFHCQLLQLIGFLNCEYMQERAHLPVYRHLSHVFFRDAGIEPPRRVITQFVYRQIL